MASLLQVFLQNFLFIILLCHACYMPHLILNVIIPVMSGEEYRFSGFPCAIVASLL
jgi:hypothetical protein